MNDHTIAVVGAGASGTLASVALLRHTGAHVVLIDTAPTGPGVAYSTTCPRHQLNVSACSMSALPDEPDDLLTWLSSHGHSYESWEYIPRALYGSYLAELPARIHRRGRLHRVHGHVVALRPQRSGSGLCLAFADGGELHVGRAILALGNSAPSRLTEHSSLPRDRVVDDPWAHHTQCRLRAARSVVIVGTGLTAVDIAIGLSRAGTPPAVTAISRHGLLPRAQRHGPAEPDRDLGLRANPKLDRIVATVKEALAEDRSRWRGVIDGLRPRSQELWQGLEHSEQLRFERDHRAWWNVHRHRAAPESADTLADMLVQGVLRVREGSIASLGSGADGGVTLTLADGEQTEYDVVVNATGPSTRIQDSANALIGNLLATGQARPDAHSVGLATSATGALIDREGCPSALVYALGPLRRGELFESAAIREIGMQADALGRLLARTPASAPSTSPSADGSSSPRQGRSPSTAKRQRRLQLIKRLLQLDSRTSRAQQRARR